MKLWEIIRNRFNEPEVGDTTERRLELFFGHIGIAVGVVSALASVVPLNIALIVWVIGYTSWEVAQIAFLGGLWWDSIVDWIGAAVTPLAIYAAINRQWRWAQELGWVVLIGSVIAALVQG